jgi:predicted small secreted protein
VIVRRRWLAPIAIGACALAAVGCGTNAGAGGDTKSTTQAQGDPHFPRGSSVGSGIAPAPAIAARVSQAAARAGCDVRAFPPEETQLQPNGTLHVETEPTYHESLPPASGLHYQVWADWGVYDKPIPFRFQVHNLEHGGIIIHLGKGLSAQARQEIQDLWTASPAYTLVVPEDFAKFPANAVVVTSWQRWLVCKPYAAKDLAAIRVFRDTYRGTGPEYAAAVNNGEGDSTPGLPTPKIADPDT